MVEERCAADKTRFDDIAIGDVRDRKAVHNAIGGTRTSERKTAMRLTKKQIGARKAREEQGREIARRHGLHALTPAELVERVAEDATGVSGPAQTLLLKHGKASLNALIAGLKHPNSKIRAVCALLMDHLADNRCVAPLADALRNDPLEAVRRCAMHSLVCDGCKECPLDTDVIAPLVTAALTDRSVSVRRRAVFYLSQQQRRDARIVVAMATVLTESSDAILRQRAARPGSAKPKASSLLNGISALWLAGVGASSPMAWARASL